MRGNVDLGPIEGCIAYLLALVVLVFGTVGFVNLWNVVMAWAGVPALPVVHLRQVGAVVFMLCLVAPAIVMVLMALIAIALHGLDLL